MKISRSVLIKSSLPINGRGANRSFTLVTADPKKRIYEDDVSRRGALFASATALAYIVSPVWHAGGLVTSQPLMDSLQRAAMQAFAEKNFAAAVTALNGLIRNDPTNPKWREMRAMSLVDGKNFVDALRDFDECLRLLGTTPTLERARVLSGRGLAFEGVSDWPAALDDYSQALDVAHSLGAEPDPYILNSRGNCHASLGEWKEARQDYLESAGGFLAARREERRAASVMQMYADGAVFASSNAALMLAQMGDDKAAVKEMQNIARRAPGNADMRIALAAMLWSAGQVEEAEAEWDFACNNITVGCAKYQDEEWLTRIRRWPPVMVARMKAFLVLRTSEGVPSAADGRKFTGFRE